MKNSIRKMASILLAALMLLMLFGCSKSGASDQKKFEGTWKATVSLTDLANESIQQSSGIDSQTFSKYFKVSKFELVLVFTFRDDGTYSLSVDEAQLNQNNKAFMDEIKAGMIKFFEDNLAEQGIDMSVDEFVEAQAGMSLDEYFDQTFPASIFDGMADSFSATGKWKAEDGKLYLSQSTSADIDTNDYDLYEFTSSSEIKLSLPAGESDGMGVYPLVLKKS